MTTYSDTLDIAPLRRHASLPMAEVESALPESVNHPEAARLARARIAALPDNPLMDPDAIVAVPASELVTDRAVLAKDLKAVPPTTRPLLPPAVRPILTAMGVFVLMLLLFKSPIIWSQLSYLTQPHAATPSASPAAASSVIPADPTITIPKINVHAPVVYEPSVAEANVQTALQSGIDHYGNTPAPGQGGNAVFFGHSSNDWWEPGNYKFVFVLLDKLAPGDRFSIDYQSVRYTYEVTGSRIVVPTDLSVLTPTSEPTVTLITCTPPGTSFKRLVVTAKQVDPSPATTKPTATPATAGSGTNLPGSAPSFLDQLGQAWNGVVQGIGSLFGASGAKPGASPAASPQVTPGQLPAVK
ncbi:MAG TPA: class D sortase [Candidatus Saccharimonadia bacterium]|nr:class D sortase [Candidatus Saccharimonadia bacterium]